MADNHELSAGGFLFFTESDARLAEAELKKIEYLESRIDYSRPESILLVYEKTIHERIFRTPVGLQYLKGLQDYLLEQPGIRREDVPDIPLYSTFGAKVREQDKPAKNRIKASPEERGKTRSRFLISAVLNVLLTLAVIAMFWIALKSDNPNIINYERNLINKYASWEQELTERERQIREKELELRTEGESDADEDRADGSESGQ